MKHEIGVSISRLETYSAYVEERSDGCVVVERNEAYWEDDIKHSFSELYEILRKMRIHRHLIVSERLALTAYFRLPEGSSFDLAPLLWPKPIFEFFAELRNQCDLCAEIKTRRGRFIRITFFKGPLAARKVMIPEAVLERAEKNLLLEETREIRSA